MASPHLVEQVGRVLDGRYRVVAPIGTGASAAVYLADDTVLRRRVAIKVLHAALAGDSGFLKRFEAEAHTAAALSHPNVMRVLDWGEQTEGPFLVLEYLGGGSLRTLLDQGTALSPSQAAQVGIQAARALEYAHRRGLVHRDVKPANLLFDDEGRLAIADFGLARALAEAALTEPGGSVLGTARYASPEQVRGLSLDGKADVYALGLVLYEVVTGRVPFSADTTIATLMGRLDAHVTAPKELGDLGPIVEWATHPDPEQRPSSQELLAALEEVTQRLPAADRLTLPGAIPIDIDRVAISDPTLLPGSIDAPPTVSVEARPLPPELSPSKRRLPIPFRKKDAAAVAANGKLSKKRRIRKPSLKQALLILLFTVLAAAASGGAYGLYYFAGSQIVVPDFEGVTLEQAMARADEAGVNLVHAGEEFSEDIPEGQTFDQSPAAGTEIYPRQEASVKTSAGPAPRQVPEVVGQNVDEATAALEAERFQVSTEGRYDEQVPSGQVLEQSLPPNSEQARDSEINLIVSSGPRPRIVPNVGGLEREEAIAEITAQQLKVNVVEDYSNDVEEGLVAGSSPGSGAEVERDSTITITISLGPDLVAVPDVEGRGESAAESALEAAGFSVSNRYGPSSGRVFATDPAAGEEVRRGASIAIYTR